MCVHVCMWMGVCVCVCVCVGGWGECVCWRVMRERRAVWRGWEGEYGCGCGCEGTGRKL